MPGFLGALGMQTASNAANAGMGLLVGKVQDKRQLKQQRKLQELQLEGNEKALAQQEAKELRMWEATNYDAQKEQMKKAGLNPALMYGMSGGGGTTVGGSGMGVGSGNAPVGGGEMLGLMTGQQTAMQAAQIELIKAQTDKTKAEAENTAGVDRTLKATQTESLLQGIETEKAKQKLTEVQTRISTFEEKIKGDTVEAMIALANYEANKALQQLNILKNDALISENTWSRKIDLVEQEYVGMMARTALTEAQTEATKAGTAKTTAEIENIANEIKLKWAQLKNETDKTKIQQKLQEFQTSFGGQASQILGQLLQFIPGKSKAQ